MEEKRVQEKPRTAISAERRLLKVNHAQGVRIVEPTKEDQGVKSEVLLSKFMYSKKGEAG